jgi:polar amino acid transport system substrate-binding protein
VGSPLLAQRCFAVAAILVAFATCTACNSVPSRTAEPQGSASAGAGVSDLLAEVRKRGKLLISTDANYQPLSFRTPDGAWHGFDVDVGREIARRLGVRPEFLDINFDVSSGGNWNGRWDVNVDSMTITRDRQRVLYFTQPYYFIPAAFVVNKASKVDSIDELSGRRIGVGTATTYQAYLEGHLDLTNENILVPAPQARAIPYDTDQLALNDLALGDGVKLDGVLTSYPFAAFQIKAGKPFRIVGTPVFYEDAAVAIDKSSPLDPKRFYQAVEEAVNAMHKDGTLTRLSMHYFGADLSHR